MLGRDRASMVRLAALSPEAARALGAGVRVDCSDVRVRLAAQAALQSDGLSAADRRWVGRLLAEAAEVDVTRTEMLRVRVTSDEIRELETRATEAGVSISEYVRRMSLGVAR